MAEAAPLVSVVIPTYNRLPYLREAIASVQAQTLRDWELIVVDDGSTDNTLSFVAAMTDTRIRTKGLKHCGSPARVRNAGVDLARGAFIAFLDSDDLWTPDKLHVQLKAFESRPDVSWSYARYTLIDAFGRALDDANRPRWVPHSGIILEQAVTGAAVIATPTVMIRSGLLRAVGGFDERLPLCEDYDLWCRLAARYATLAIDRPLGRVRVHGERVLIRPGDMDRAWLNLCERVLATHPRASAEVACRREAVRRAARLVRLSVRSRSRHEALTTLSRAWRYRSTSVASWLTLGATVMAIPLLLMRPPLDADRSN